MQACAMNFIAHGNEPAHGLAVASSGFQPAITVTSTASATIIFPLVSLDTDAFAVSPKPRDGL